MSRGTAAASGTVGVTTTSSRIKIEWRATGSLQPPLGPAALRRPAGDRGEHHQIPGGGGGGRGSRGGGHCGRDTNGSKTKWAILPNSPQGPKCASARSNSPWPDPAHLHLPPSSPPESRRPLRAFVSSVP